MLETEPVGVEAYISFVGMNTFVAPVRFVRMGDNGYFMFDTCALMAGAQRYTWRFGLHGLWPEQNSLRHAYFPIYVQGHGWNMALWMVIKGYTQTQQKVEFLERGTQSFVELFPKGVTLSAAELALFTLETIEAKCLALGPVPDRLALQSELLGIYVEKAQMPVRLSQRCHNIPLIWAGGSAEYNEMVNLITFQDGSVLVLKQSGMLVQ